MLTTQTRAPNAAVAPGQCCCVSLSNKAFLPLLPIPPQTIFCKDSNVPNFALQRQYAASCRRTRARPAPAGPTNLNSRRRSSARTTKVGDEFWSIVSIYYLAVAEKGVPPAQFRVGALSSAVAGCTNSTAFAGVERESANARRRPAPSRARPHGARGVVARRRAIGVDGVTACRPRI